MLVIESVLIHTKCLSQRTFQKNAIIKFKQLFNFEDTFSSSQTPNSHQKRKKCFTTHKSERNKITIKKVK